MNHDRMTELLNTLVPRPGVLQNVIDGVALFRITKSTQRMPQSYDSSIIILAQGKKRVYIGEEEIDYDAMNYLVVSVPLPLECDTTASEEKPMLGITIKINTNIIGEILLALDDEQKTAAVQLPKGIYSEAVDEKLENSVIRLLESLTNEQEKRFLGPMIMREIIFRVLSAQNGDALRALAYRNQRFFQIARILDKIHKTYNSKFELNALAREAGMSVSAFHSSFKTVTNTSPLQYIKNVKLHKARLLMLQDGLNASETSQKVGYESPSQFNREYKRLFGVSPGRDVA